MLAIGITSVLVCVLAASGLAYGVWRFGQLDRTDLDLPEAASGAPENFLIVGSDSRDGFDAEDADAGGIVGLETAGRRSDTIIVARIDPSSEQVSVLSLPRDLWAPIAGSDRSAKINAAYGQGEQVLADTIQASFGIEIHHYVEVDFRGFKRVVEAVDGVPLYFDRAMRDPNSGLDIAEAGCVTLDGDQALAFARARNLRFDTGDGDFEVDPTADLGRISRQQVFMRQALRRSVDQGLTDPVTLNRLVDVALDSVTIDDALDARDLLSLGRRFSSFDADQMETHSLPVEDFRAPDGSAALRLLDAEAQSTLNLFRGLPPDAGSETTVDVRVLNGTGTANQAAAVADDLEAIGFEIDGEPGNAEEVGPPTVARSEVHHGSGSEAGAELVARHLSAGAELVEDATLDDGEVVLVTGMDFEAVTATLAPPTSEPAIADPGEPAGEEEEPGPTTTTVVGVTPGEAPRGVDCG
ncbi:LCP family protein [soil metagenome]